MAIPATSAVTPLPVIGFSQAAAPQPAQAEGEKTAPQNSGGPQETKPARPGQAEENAPQTGRPGQAVPQAEQAEAVEDQGGSESAANGIRELSPEEKQRVAELKAIDQAVRQHEQAHLSAAGGLARGGASFSYVTGPDGKQYAVGGEVQIDTSGVPDDPSATITKAQNIRRAALAPAKPSSQDQRVAARATQLEFEARAALAQERTEEAREQAAPEEPAPVFSGGQELPQQSNPLSQFA